MLNANVAWIHASDEFPWIIDDTTFFVTPITMLLVLVLSLFELDVIFYLLQRLLVSISCSMMSGA